MMEKMNKWLSAHKKLCVITGIFGLLVSPFFMAGISGSDHTVPFTGHSGCSRTVFL